MSILSLRLWQMLRPLAVHPLCLRGTVIVLSLKVFKDIERYPVTTWVRACILVKPCRNAYLDWNMTQQDKHPRWSKRLLAILRGCHCDVRMCESQVHTVTTQSFSFDLQFAGGASARSGKFLIALRGCAGCRVNLLTFWAIWQKVLQLHVDWSLDSFGTVTCPILLYTPLYFLYKIRWVDPWFYAPPFFLDFALLAV